MTKKKRGLAAYKKRSSKRAKKNNDIVAKTNPPLAQDLAEFIVPGFAGYAGTRMTSRVVHGMILKKYPKLAKHASVLSTLGAATAAWLLVHRVEKIKQYHTPVVVGAGIAAIQTVVQAYLPKYGWMVSDHNLNAQPGQSLRARVTSNSTSTSTSTSSANIALPPPINALSTEEIKEELDDLDMGILTGDAGNSLGDEEMDLMIDDAVH